MLGGEVFERSVSSGHGFGWGLAGLLLVQLQWLMGGGWGSWPKKPKGPHVVLVVVVSLAHEELSAKSDEDEVV